MTDDEREAEGAEEQVEDLAAPAEMQSDVTGGLYQCKLEGSYVPGISSVPAGGQISPEPAKLPTKFPPPGAV